MSKRLTSIYLESFLCSTHVTGCVESVSTFCECPAFMWLAGIFKDFQLKFTLFARNQISRYTFILFSCTPQWIVFPMQKKFWIEIFYAKENLNWNRYTFAMGILFSAEFKWLFTDMGGIPAVFHFTYSDRQTLMFYSLEQIPYYFRHGKIGFGGNVKLSDTSHLKWSWN